MTTELHITSDELTSVARGLAATRFPGVIASVYDLVPPELHPVLDGRFLATLVARGLLVVDEDGNLRPDGILQPVVQIIRTHRIHVAVEQTEPASQPDTVLICDILAGNGGAVRHWIGDPLHTLELRLAAEDPRSAAVELLSSLVDRSPGNGRPHRKSRRGVLSDLANLVSPSNGGWRRITTLTRAHHVAPTTFVAGFLGILDGGADELWLAHTDDELPTSEAMVTISPASAADVDAAIQALTAA